MNYKLIENLVPPNFSDTIWREFEENVQWRFGHSSSGVKGNWDPNDSMILDSVQFVHPIIDNNQPMSNLYSLCIPIVWFLEKELGVNIKNIIRMKANCLTRDGFEFKYNPPHVDVHHPGCYSLVYYIHDSDGDTYIFDKSAPDPHLGLTVIDRISPKKGSALLIPSHQYHASSNPIITPRRMIINTVMEFDRNV